METKLILCDCGSAEHQLILQYFNDEKPEFQILYIHVHLTHWENIFRRIWHAIRYVFGYHCKYGHWDEILITPQTAMDLIEYLQFFVDRRDTIAP